MINWELPMDLRQWNCSSLQRENGEQKCFLIQFKSFMIHLYPKIDQIVPSYTCIFNFLFVGNNIWSVGGGGRRKVKRKINFYKLFFRVLLHSGLWENIIIVSAKLYIGSFLCPKLIYLAWKIFKSPHFTILVVKFRKKNIQALMRTFLTN